MPLDVIGYYHCCDSTSLFLLELMGDVNFCVLNDGTPTCRYVVDGFPQLSGERSPPYYHLRTKFSYLSILHRNPLLKHRICEADWSKFWSNMMQSITNLPSITQTNIVEVYNAFMAALLSAADSYILLKNPKCDKIRSPVWWDAEWSAIAKECNRTENLFAEDLSSENYVNF